MREVLDGTVVFFVWWSVWSLLDAYALKFTPLSELTVLACCALVRLGPALCTRVRERFARGQESLKRVLDTV